MLEFAQCLADLGSATQQVQVLAVQELLPGLLKPLTHGVQKPSLLLFLQPSDALLKIRHSLTHTLNCGLPVFKVVHYQS